MRALVLPAPLRVTLMAMLAALLSFGTLAPAADAKKKKRRALPTVSSVLPATASLNDIMVIKGKNFRVGNGANTVIFRKASGGKFLFLPTLTASATRLTFKVPQSVINDLDAVSGVQKSTRYQVRVVAARATGGFTAVGKSPLILPQPGGLSTTDCDKDGVADDVDADDDNDGLSDAIETQYKMNTCSVDSDGDGLWDSYEFQSALDLNGVALPYPGKKPWPNPLDASDANYDFDGDGLRLNEEHKLWQAAGRPFPLNYSDGTQYTGGLVLAPNPDIYGLDIDASSVIKGGPPDVRSGVGYISDDEKDYDGDGLANVHEFSLGMTQGSWKAYSEKAGEGVYTLRPFSDLDPTDADSDGDGVIDGLDDQDQDAWNNISELYRAPTYATNFIAYMVNPFNPCLPDWKSRTCSRYLPAGSEPWSPFDIEGGPPTAPIGWDAGNGPIDSPTPDYVPAG